MIKVEVMNKADKSQKAETAFKLFDKNRDGYITREEFTKVFTFFCDGMYRLSQQTSSLFRGLFGANISKNN